MPSSIVLMVLVGMLVVAVAVGVELATFSVLNFANSFRFGICPVGYGP